MKFKTKGISLLLSIAMLLSMFPATSFALNLSNTEFIKPGTTEANMPEMKTVAVKVNSAGDGYDIIVNSFNENNIFNKQRKQYAITVSTIKKVKKLSISVLGEISGL